MACDVLYKIRLLLWVMGVCDVIRNGREDDHILCFTKLTFELIEKNAEITEKFFARGVESWFRFICLSW